MSYDCVVVHYGLLRLRVLALCNRRDLQGIRRMRERVGEKMYELMKEKKVEGLVGYHKQMFPE